MLDTELLERIFYRLKDPVDRCAMALALPRARLVLGANERANMPFKVVRTRGQDSLEHFFPELDAFVKEVLQVLPLKTHHSLCPTRSFITQTACVKHLFFAKRTLAWLPPAHVKNKQKLFDPVQAVCASVYQHGGITHLRYKLALSKHASLESERHLEAFIARQERIFVRTERLKKAVNDMLVSLNLEPAVGHTPSTPEAMSWIERKRFNRSGMRWVGGAGGGEEVGEYRGGPRYGPRDGTADAAAARWEDNKPCTHQEAVSSEVRAVIDNRNMRRSFVAEALRNVFDCPIEHADYSQEIKDYINHDYGNFQRCVDEFVDERLFGMLSSRSCDTSFLC